MNDKKETIKVIVIDPSAVTRYLITEILEQTGDIEVIASVHDTADALHKIQMLRPHVITLDVNMSGMSSLTFLENLMEYHPTPVVIVSAMTKHQSSSVIKAMEIGAVGFVAKKTSQSWSGILNLGEEIVEKVRTASGMPVPGNITANRQAATGNF